MTRLFLSFYLFIAISLITITAGLNQFFDYDSASLSPAQEAWLTLFKTHQSQPDQLISSLKSANFNYRYSQIDQVAVSKTISASLAKKEIVHGFSPSGWKVYIPLHTNRVIVVSIPQLATQEQPFWVYSSVFFLILGLVIAIYIYPLWRDLSRLITYTRELNPDGSISLPELSRHSPLNDISKALQSLSNKVQQLLTNQRELAGAVTHEFKTPLARLKFALSSEKGLSIEQATEARKDVDELDQLVQEMLDFTRYQVITPELHMEDIPLFELCEQQVKHFSLLSDLSMSVTGDSPTIIGDGQLIERVVNNLLSNAIRHANSKVSIIIESSASEISLLVDDDGPGVHGKDKQAVFDPFYRPDSARSRPQGGAGLGLATVKRIAQWHNATCAVEDSPFGGARFAITFYPSNRLIKKSHD